MAESYVIRIHCNSALDGSDTGSGGWTRGLLERIMEHGLRMRAAEKAGGNKSKLEKESPLYRYHAEHGERWTAYYILQGSRPTAFTKFGYLADCVLRLLDSVFQFLNWSIGDDYTYFTDRRFHFLLPPQLMEAFGIAETHSAPMIALQQALGVYGVNEDLPSAQWLTRSGNDLSVLQYGAANALSVIIDDTYSIRTVTDAAFHIKMSNSALEYIKTQGHDSKFRCFTLVELTPLGVPHHFNLAGVAEDRPHYEEASWDAVKLFFEADIDGQPRIQAVYAGCSYAGLWKEEYERDIASMSIFEAAEGLLVVTERLKAIQTPVLDKGKPKVWDNMNHLCAYCKEHFATGIKLKDHVMQDPCYSKWQGKAAGLKGHVADTTNLYWPFIRELPTCRMPSRDKADFIDHLQSSEKCAQRQPLWAPYL
ncbi:hypothetical protein LTR85_007708 [Meristemomyces frigidus]|nr:hypothetical protein LTR85_007708 [Meristemomyces frigidus]